MRNTRFGFLLGIHVKSPNSSKHVGIGKNPKENFILFLSGNDNFQSGSSAKNVTNVLLFFKQSKLQFLFLPNTGMTPGFIVSCVKFGYFSIMNDSAICQLEPVNTQINNSVISQTCLRISWFLFQIFLRLVNSRISPATEIFNHFSFDIPIPDVGCT